MILFCSLVYIINDEKNITLKRQTDTVVVMTTALSSVAFCVFSTLRWIE